MRFRALLKKKRWLRRVMVCALVGVVLTLVTAWVPWRYQHVYPSKLLRSSESVNGFWIVGQMGGTMWQDWIQVSNSQAERPSSFGDGTVILTPEQVRRRARFDDPLAEKQLWLAGGDLFMHARVGWPLRCFRMYVLTDMASREDKYSGDWYLNPTNPSGFDMKYHLPAIPISLGLVVNTAVYTFIVAAPIFGVSYVRRSWRARRGRCGNCGYDLEGITTDRCPECGMAIEKPRAK